MTKIARRQHFIARFYLRNFADPIFSDTLRVYDMKKRRWETRSPDGVGWFPHLCSMIDNKGNRTDEFDRFLKTNVEDPAVPALKKFAMREVLDAKERSAIAFFIALTAARSPELMKLNVAQHLGRLPKNDRAELDELVKLWCHSVNRTYNTDSHREFIKPSSFGAMWLWSQSLKSRLVKWKWHLINTTRDQPFVTSDRPVFAQWDRKDGIRLLSFPVSSEIALLIVDGGQLSDSRNCSHDISAINRQSIHRAVEFIAACKTAFPGDDTLGNTGKSA